MEAIMKRITKILIALMLAAPLTGCHYLDVDSELGLTEEDVFNTTKNFKAYHILGRCGVYLPQHPLRISPVHRLEPLPLHLGLRHGCRGCRALYPLAV